MTDRRECLQHLAVLYLGMAHRTDDYLSDAELASITEMLHAHEPEMEWAAVQDVVMDVLGRYAHAGDAEALTTAAASALESVLTPDQKRRVLEDLGRVAHADGVVLEGEQGLMARLGRQWGVEREPDVPEAAVAGDGAGWGVVHDLAYIYLHLAHATDNELSATERQVLRTKLHEWQPQHDLDALDRVFQEALAQYARGTDEALLERAIVSVRAHLPHSQRMAALNDLVKIANADGIFLDTEEDLINHLLAAWDVDPHASYGAHGTKKDREGRR